MTSRKYFSALSCLVLLAIFVASCKDSTSTETQEQPTGTEHKSGAERTLDKEAFEAGFNESGAVLVDVRFPQEFEQGHIKGAININFFDPQFKNQLLELKKNKKYYLYCKNENTSFRSMNFMTSNGFKEVYILKGGYEAWTATAAK